jgi:hypothetical protein
MRSSTSPSPAANDAYCQGFSAVQHGAAIVLRAARRWPMEDHQPHPPHGRTQIRGPQGKSDRGRDRQPIGQDNRGGGPRGYAAEKMIKGRNPHIPTTRSAFWSARSSIPARSRTAMVRHPCWRTCGTRFRAGPSIRRWRLRGDKLKSALQTFCKWTIEVVKRSDTPRDLSCCRGVGSSNGHWRG